ncbi:MAG: hypothetical protein Q8J69_02760 [Sphingobacteriaceae bacterium]|nr:hypothetical protein [Sphingobacteriaceae bacterium]
MKKYYLWCYTFARLIKGNSMPEVTANIIASILPMFVLFTIVRFQTDIEAKALVAPFVLFSILLMIFLHFGISKTLVSEFKNKYRNLPRKKRLLIGAFVFTLEVASFYCFTFL